MRTETSQIGVSTPEVTTQAEAKLSFKEKLGYGLGDFASNLIFMAVGAFVVFYYTDVIGVSGAVIGTIILVSRLLDGLTDIGMGAIVDKTTSKHGKARPWLLWMAIPYAIGTILLFSVPDFSTLGKFIYIAVTYNIIHLIYTAINIPYGVLNSLMTQDQYQRATLNLFRMFMATAAATFILYFTLPFVSAFGGGERGWQVTFSIFGCLAAVIFIITFYTTKERVIPTNNKAQSKVPLKLGIKALIKNKYWIIMVLFGLVTYTGMGLQNGVNVYYAQYILNDPDWVGPIGLASTIPIMVGLLLVAPLIKKMGKRNAIICGIILTIIGSVIMLIEPENATLILVGTVIRALGMVPVVGSIFAMLADTIEYGEWKSGLRTEGLVYSAGSFGTKVGMGFGAAMLGWGLSLGGYNGTLEVQSATAINAIIFLFIFIPVMIAAAQLILMYLYRLDQEYPQILKDLQQRQDSNQ
ncbi:MFS transporter [Caldalkalibacillus salinus]|uniref:MFS transporter n=1 Tax=Caldalkalibacillus salinus TaxID=2803787 RepID=UPI001922672B|nr:MFS transporter [Caldalkalibacillus salinus]